MERLLKIGFRKVGDWRLENNQPIFCLENEAESRNILYSFISNENILYIGKTAQELKKRLYGYQNPGPTQSTNIKNNSFINEKLECGETVEIYALPDNGLMHYGGFHLNLAAGLEDSLVSSIKPAWNKTGK